MSAEPGNDVAVRWAATEARSRHVPLLLLHVIEDGDPVDLLEAARSVALLELAESRIFGEAVHGVPHRVLTSESSDASVIVLGSRPRTPPNGVLLGSACDHVVAGAHCPVVVVRPGTQDGPVVAAADGSELSQAVLAFAFAHASRRHLPLTAMLAWRSHGGAGGVDGARSRAAHLLAGQVGTWQEKYPDVDVRQRVVESSPVTALLEASVSASLLVLGTRAASYPSARPFGSVSHAVLQQSSCPVAVVHANDP